MRARPKEATGRLAKFINSLHTLALATGSAARFDPSSALPGPQHFRISGASAQTRPERFSLARVLERKRSTGGLARRRGRAAFPSPLHALPSQAGAFHHRDWADPLALHNPRADWRRWNGSRLSRPRRTARSRRCRQSSSQGLTDRRNRAKTVSRGSAGPGEAKPSQHRDGVRLRRRKRCRFSGDRIHPGYDAGCEADRRLLAGEAGAESRDSIGGGIGSRSRPEFYSPRFEAGKFTADSGQPAEDSRLWSGETGDPGQPDRRHKNGRGKQGADWNAALHGAGTAARGPGRSEE